jgi:hypothetical protein
VASTTGRRLFVSLGRLRARGFSSDVSSPQPRRIVHRKHPNPASPALAMAALAGFFGTLLLGSSKGRGCGKPRHQQCAIAVVGDASHDRRHLIGENGRQRLERHQAFA